MSLVENGQSDAALLAAVRAGQPSALHTLYSRYCAGAYTLALHMLGTDAEAEACVHAVFLTLWRDPPGDDTLACAQWVRGAVHAGAQQRLRARVSAHPSGYPPLVVGGTCAAGRRPSKATGPDPPAAYVCWISPHFSACSPAELAVPSGTCRWHWCQSSCAPVCAPCVPRSKQIYRRLSC